MSGDEAQSSNESIDTQLDNIFCAARTAAQSKPEAKSFQEIIEDAEVLQPSDTDGAEAVLASAVAANLPSTKLALVMATIKRTTKLPMGALRETFKSIRKSAGSANTLDDIGERVVREALNRFYQGGRFLTRSNGVFWRYTGSYWLIEQEEHVASNLLAVIRESVRPDAIGYSGALSQALTLMRADRAQPLDVFGFLHDPRPIINCANGELDVSVYPPQLRPHSPDSYLTCCLPFDYDPGADCPLYDQTVAEIFANSKDPAGLTAFWNEWFGYVLQPVRDIPGWFLMSGQGSNGKSKLLETVSRMLGDAVVSTKISTLEERFGLAPLLGKLLLIDDDVDANTKLPDGGLKKISEKKKLSIEFKNQTPFDAFLRVVPVMLANNFPLTSDLSYGMQRRAHVIPFDRQFRNDEADPNRFPRIWGEEMPGVLNRALEGLQRLRHRGHFAQQIDKENAFKQWMGEANSLTTFANECLTRVNDSVRPAINIHDIYRIYQVWAAEAGVRNMVARNRLKAGFVSLGYQTSRTNGMTTLPCVKLSEYGARLWRTISLQSAGFVDYGSQD